MRPEIHDQRTEDDGDDRLGLEIAAAGDPCVAPRPKHVAQVRSALLAELSPCLPSPRSWQWSSRLIFGSGLAAAALFFAVWTFNRPAIAWAQVAQALQGKAWAHGKVAGPDGKVLYEEWLSASRDRAAVRGGPETEFHDYLQKVLTKYKVADGVVYRLPEPPPQAAGDGSFLRLALDLLHDPKGPGKFPFPGTELIREDRRGVTDAGKDWVEISLTLRVAGGSRGELVTMLIRVDPASMLPASLTMDAEDGKRYSAAIDYPERGPADIYDLGAPRDAKVVERVVADEVGRVMTTLKAGRHAFDDYCAFVIEKRIKPNNYLPMTMVYRLWRKGENWRIERLRPPSLEWAPPAEADSAAWWKAHQGEFTFIPVLIGNGKEYWDYYLADSWQPGMPVPQVGKRESTGQTVGPNALMGPADDPIIPFWCQELLPEQVGHPTAGIWEPDSDREFLVEKKPTDGPPGTILFRGRDVSPTAAGKPDHFRVWLDPDASYVAMRHEMRLSEPKQPDKVAWVAKRVVESVAKSPKGHWYPTKTRWTGYKGEHEIVRSLFVDFDAKVPDALFEPMK